MSSSVASLVTDDMWAEAKNKYDEETRQLGKEGRSKERHDEILDFLSSWDMHTPQERRRISHGNASWWRRTYVVHDGVLMQHEKPRAAAGSAAAPEATTASQLTLTQVSHRERFFEDIKEVHVACACSTAGVPALRPAVLS